KELTKPNILNINIEKQYVGSLQQNEYWNVLAELRSRIEKYQNSGKVDYNKFTTLTNMAYKLESSEWYNPGTSDFISIQNKKEFYKIVSSIFKLLDDKTLSLNTKTTKEQYSQNNGIKEYSRITYISKAGFDIDDSKGDDYGTGAYTYPADPVYEQGSCDLRRFSVRKSEKFIDFSVRLAKLPNPFESPLGFSIPQIDIYIDLNSRTGLGNTQLLPGRNAFTKPENAWEYCISINGWSSMLYQLGLNNKIVDVAELDTTVDKKFNSVSVDIPTEILDGDPFLWKYIVCTLAYDKENELDHIKYIKEEADEKNFGGRNRKTLPNIIDIILPDNLTQKNIMDNRSKGMIELPALSINKKQ
ncbi:glucodextranase DOMON-like domain-containing protein, partial [bacterium]